MRTGSAWPDATAKASAVAAVLLAEVTGLAGGALVHGDLSCRPWWGHKRDLGRHWGEVTAPPTSLAARVGAPLAPARGDERPAAGRAGGDPVVTAVVTRRHLRSRLLAWRRARRRGEARRRASATAGSPSPGGTAWRPLTPILTQRNRPTFTRTRSARACHPTTGQRCRGCRLSGARGCRCAG